jgi:uncharacterized protein (TIGR02646 family)
MIQVNFTPPAGDRRWDKWLQDTALETRRLNIKVRHNERYGFKSSLYKRMRQTIFDAFYGKCAYCEAKFILTETGDVEHFRPKGSLTDEHDQRVLLSSRGKIIGPHPGYYWLAYDWRNLLPSCTKCNRPGRTRDGHLVGKGTRFPVLKNSAFKPGHARRPSEIKKERPAFIHPGQEDPQAHMRFDALSGQLIPKTKRGQLSINLLDLNREGLCEERKDIYLSVPALALAARLDAENGKWPAFLEKLRIINGYKDGRKPYSWVGRRALQDNPVLVRRLDVLSRRP